MKSQQKAKRKARAKPKPNLPHALPADVGLSLVTFLLVELTAEEKDFLVHHLFPILSPECLLSFAEEMLVAKKDASDLAKETTYHDAVKQYQQNGKHGKRPESPTYRYHAFRTSTREISTDEEILRFGGVKKLTIRQMIYLHLVHRAYDRLVQHTQSRHLDQRRSEGTTCWQVIAKWFNNPSHLTQQQRDALTPHFPSSSPMTPVTRKRVSTSPTSTPRINKRARTNPTSISTSTETSMTAPVTYMETDSFHPAAPLHPHLHPHSSQPPPHQLYQDYPLSTTAPSAWNSKYNSQPNHRFDSQSQLHHDLENMYDLHGMNQREDEVEALRGRVSFTPPPAASASLPSQPSINCDQFVDSLLSSSSQADDDDWNQHPDLDALKLPDLPLDDISFTSPFLSPSSPFPSPLLSPLPALFPELDPFDA